jgi:2'-5' RNA ligase
MNAHDKIKGGWAVMFRLGLPKAVSDVALRWLAEAEHREAAKLDPHMTLLFVGRDLEARHEPIVVDVGRRVAASAETPRTLMGTGYLQMFGGKRDHLVAMIDRTQQLELLRRGLETVFKQAGIPIRQDFSFAPHVTLGIGQPGDQPPQHRLPGATFDVLGVEVKIGSGRVDFMPLAGRA